MSFIMLFKIILILLFFKFCKSALISELSCNFNDLCDYSSYGNNTGWNIKTNSSPRESFLLDGPLAGISDSYLELNGEAGGLESPTIRLAGEYCLSLDYYLFSSSATLNIYAQRTRFPVVPETYHPIASREQHFPLFNRNEKSSFVDRWQHFESNYLFEYDEYVVRIDGGTTINKTLAIDNMKFNEGPCRVTPSADKVCNFDNIVGGVNDTDNNCDWLTIVRNNLTGLQGNELEDARTRLRFHVKSFNHRQFLDVDHTTKSKYGGFLNAYSTFTYKPTLYLTDALTPQDGAHCLSFAYGSHGKFEVLEKELDYETVNIIWQSPEDVHEVWWEPAQVDIDPVVNIQIGIKLTRGGGKLDGIRLSKGKCKPFMECDFKNGMCDWIRNRELRGYRGDWLVGRGRAAVPLAEHQWIDNYDADYLSLDSHHITRRNENQKLSLSSMIIQETGDYCFRFSFFAIAGREPSVKERCLPLFQNMVMPELEMAITGNTSGWREGSANIRAKNIFSLEIIPGARWEAGMENTLFRIRKTTLEKGLCKSNSTRVQQFGPINYHCYRTGHNIPMYRSCDGVIDCPMGEDEGDNCTPHQCENGGIPCRRRKHHFCLTDVTQYCNGQRDCDDGSDEDPRMCNADSFCDNYCLNDGTCSFEDFKCNCDAGFKGKRCSAN